MHQVREQRRQAHPRYSLSYCPVTIARDTYYVRYELTWNHCATKQPQPLRSILSSTMGNKNESKATRREPQPSALSKRQARKQAGHHTCRKSELFFWNSNHEKKNARNSTQECGQMDANSHLRSDHRGHGSERCSEHPSQWARTQGGHGIEQAEAKSRAYKAHRN